MPDEELNVEETAELETDDTATDDGGGTDESGGETKNVPLKALQKERELRKQAQSEAKQLKQLTGEYEKEIFKAYTDEQHYHERQEKMREARPELFNKKGEPKPTDEMNKPDQQFIKKYEQQERKIQELESKLSYYVDKQDSREFHKELQGTVDGLDDYTGKQRGEIYDRALAFLAKSAKDKQNYPDGMMTINKAVKLAKQREDEHITEVLEYRQKQAERKSEDARRRPFGESDIPPETFRTKEGKPRNKEEIWANASRIIGDDIDRTGW